MDLAGEAVKMAGALAVVVALMFGVYMIVTRFMGNGLPGQHGPVLYLLGGLRLGPGKSIMLVEVAEEVLVLGATTRELTLLTRIEDPQRVAQLRPTGGPKLHLWSRSSRNAKDKGPSAGRESVEASLAVFPQQ